MLTRRTALATGAVAVARPAPAADPPKPAGPLPVRDVKVHEFTAADGKPTDLYLEVLTESGVSGWSGPVYPESAFIVRSVLRPKLLGADALAGEALWQLMRGADRHGRAGHFMMAVSGLDIALWDVRGKHLGQPVYRLLGGPSRLAVPVYASLLGFPTDPPAARKTARDFFDRGFAAQKWFFDHGPADGPAGMDANVALVRGLREELGDGAELLFDCKWAWDAAYTVAFAKRVRQYAPKFLEEPVRSENLDAYQLIRREAGVPLAAGEHLYSRWEAKRYLDAGVLDFLQNDPEWCGGITELVKTCHLAEVYGVPVLPHGHGLWAAVHVVAAQPARVCPFVEYLFHYMPGKLYFQTPRPVPEKGRLALPTAPGLGFAIDPDRVAKRREWTGA